MATRFLTFSGTALLAVAVGAGHVLAVDGVIEINQARALAGGVVGGDEPGFPVSLSQRGSYVLTSDLVVGDPDSHGIVVEVPDVASI